MAKELDTPYGRIAISDEVIATIAGAAATECYGIVGMASRKIKDGIAEMLGRENMSRGVEVHVDGDKVAVRLYIIVGYGTKIREVGHNVSEQVKYVLQSTTGLDVPRVGIVVQGVKVRDGR
jgi:uncharacterized alkaline shock family protein YloU